MSSQLGQMPTLFLKYLTAIIYILQCAAIQIFHTLKISFKPFYQFNSIFFLLNSKFCTILIPIFNSKKVIDEKGLNSVLEYFAGVSISTDKGASKIVESEILFWYQNCEKCLYSSHNMHTHELFEDLLI